MMETKSIGILSKNVQVSQKLISRLNRRGEYVIEIRCSGHQEVFDHTVGPEWLARVVLEGEKDLRNEFQRYSNLIAKMAD